jgi:3-phenylpropionate/trans-cinnamate dioxygenase ferredoxin reductase component
MRRVVVVGGGPAAVSAVQTLRGEGFHGELTLVSAEAALPYDRPPLSKQLLAGAWDVDKTVLQPRTRFDELGVRLRLGSPAVALNPGSRRLRLADGVELDFDGLIIATGLAPRRLPFGHELAGVHLLRDASDALALRDDFKRMPALVVIGAGVLGAEVAATARGLGLDVSMVDPLAVPMQRQFGAMIGTRLAELHRSQGVRLCFGVGVASITGQAGRVVSVALTDGRSLPADCVLVAIGATPAAQWLGSSGLPLGDGIECDEHCRAAPGIYAAGDVASWYHRGYRRRQRFEHRMNATEHGAAAARNLVLGDTEPYTPFPYFWTNQYTTRIQAYGDLSRPARIVVVEGGLDEERFVAEYRDEFDSAVGVLGWNSPKTVRPYRQHVASRQQNRTETMIGAAT